MSEFLGLFLTLAGLILGLGAVTVIDLHGFLAQKSEYWTEATTRIHKVTKPLIWAGTILFIIGSYLLYINSLVDELFLYQILIAGALVMNGLFLSFAVSPFLLRREREGRSAEILPPVWQWKIRISFIISFLGWWSLVLLLVYSLLY